MKNFIRVTSKYPYYSYLERYPAAFLRKYQTEEYFFLGRKSAWKSLIYKFSADHINLEEEHNFKYKTHLSFVWVSYRLAWIFFTYFCLYTVAFLGDQGRAFNVAEYDHLVNPTAENDFPARYERFYLVDRPMKY
eukprot:TRINITY_DN255_c0_g1_i1.p1 TRINITY_DN255_c0_g1~~TRINITY_DN255_c0_g1_i1.p1  ORF type:complete len:134 (+),score=39.01 TRINITY_DN255_c0_g1_i1:163-564(+)